MTESSQCAFIRHYNQRHNNQEEGLYQPQAQPKIHINKKEFHRSPAAHLMLSEWVPKVKGANKL